MTSQPQPRGAFGERGIAPARQLRVLDQEDETSHTRRVHGCEIAVEVASVDESRVSLRRSSLARQDGHAEPTTRRCQQLRADPVDAQLVAKAGVRGGLGNRVAQFRWPLDRGQKWPPGSNGWPQNGQAGRPACTSCSAWRTKPRAAGTPIRMRTRSGPAGSSSGTSSSSSSASADRASTTTSADEASHERAIRPARKISTSGSSRCASTGAGSTPSSDRPDQLQELQHPGGERGDLCLLDPDRDQGLALASLEVEGSRARSADRTGHEPIRLVE